MNWHNSYIGLEFKLDGRDRSGVDCYGLVCLVYKECHGIELNQFTGIFVDHTPKTILKIADVMTKDRDNWIPATDIKAFDMIQLRTGRHAFHVGVAVNNTSFMHVEDGISCVLERFDSPLWKNRIEWIYRHPDIK